MDGSYAFPTPRSWEMASRVYASAAEADRKRAVSACVGVEAAEKLFNFLRVYRKVDARKIVVAGLAMDFTKGQAADPSFLYAAVFSVGAYLVNEAEVSDENLPNLVKFLRSKGLDPEYQFLFLRQIRRRDGDQGPHRSREAAAGPKEVPSRGEALDRKSVV
jgi:hypothetical protein